MRVAISPVYAPVLARCIAGLLSILMVVSPMAGQASSSQTPRTADSASPKAKKPVKPKASAKKKAKAGSSAKAAAEPESSATPLANSKKKGKAGVRAGKTTEPDASVEKPAKAVGSAKKGARSKKPVSKAAKAARAARTARIKQAFVASSELRPMAQQLASLRTPAAYAGVTEFAHRHSGDAAAAAYLALGHAYLLDKRFPEAVANLRQANRLSEVLADYADFLSAQASHEAGSQAAAEAVLHGFTVRYPDSIFNAQAPELEANVLLAMDDAAGAQRVLAAAADFAGNRAGFQLAQAQAAFALGQTQEALQDFRRLLLSHPLSAEAQIARSKLISLGAESTLSTAELRTLGDAYYNAGRYADASEEYHALARVPGMDAQTRNGYAVAEAACDLKRKMLTTAEAEALADTPDENGARRLYLLMELARNRNDLNQQQRIVNQMESRFPQSPWLAEALYSSGNMYLLRREYPTAVDYYSYLATHFPGSKNAATAHWRAGWLSYRQGLYGDAERLFDEQIRLYPGAKETVSALYWRGRLYESQDRKPAMAAANYRTLLRAYQHYFYAQMARQRLAALGDSLPVAAPQLDNFQAITVPHLEESFPVDSPHLAVARLLANAGLNDYIAQEIASDPDSSSWSALAEAQIYASYGETFRAMRALKRALPYAASAPINSIPLAYWRILFPEPWWETIKAESARNNLDPYMVASLIRQESEFNPSAVSHANAYGLMQLLPSVGKQMAREEGMSHFQTFQLLDPATNIRLGTRYLRKTLDRFGGVPEYGLAAYNAGDERVADWQAAGPYSGIDEFVESIPFTETREYVEAILRNRETYKAIDEFAGSRGRVGMGASQ
ncbi:MAG: transglycosylase SLT domain-containing protein [Terracidiphilus sp.]|nr:transglycosylase SLT domain-containing protein [Terracidiphilus sp.]MDR3776921.1 transglycosylase SLT domain-containing protein [Terracidiphilus sp.]